MAKKDPYLSELEGAEESGTEEEAGTEIDLGGDTASHADRGDGPLAEDVLNLSPDIPVPMVVVMGRKNVTMRDLLDLQSGQVIDLDKGPAEPVDLVIGGKVIGKGELVNVDGHLGVRILKLLK